mmetsp:Transcript_24179/g.52768  ORF Transcript_24179/g.52768 Transcript_24179/m.52768 type:complete len:303 (-) Transcript_24179:595-1503(-)
MRITTLPPSALEHIIAQLPFRDKAALAGTCTLLRIAALDCLAQISELDVTGLGRFRINAACDFAAKYCKNLTSILAGYSNLNDDTLAALVVANPQLTQLRVPGCRFLGRKGLESVVQHCSSIQWLDIQGCTGIDKNTLRMLLVITCSKSLEVLNLSGTQVDDGCLELLSARCLRSLNLDWERGLNSSVSSCGLQALATRARQHKASPQSSQPDADRIPHLPLQELSLAHRKAFDNNGLSGWRLSSPPSTRPTWCPSSQTLPSQTPFAIWGSRASPPAWRTRTCGGSGGCSRWRSWTSRATTG